jgi:leucyl aminopeptidase
LGFGDDASFSQVNNTDAEGRLTLADALVYAGQLKVDKVLSLLFSTHP